MPVIVATKNGEQTFNKDVITIGSMGNCDVVVPVSVKILIIVDTSQGGCRVVNKTAAPEVLFRGAPMTTALNIEKACKLMIDGTDEFIGIKNLQTAVVPRQQAAPIPQQQNNMPARPQGQRRPMPKRPAPAPQPQVTMSSIAEQDFDEDDIRDLYGDQVNASTTIKLDKRKEDIEVRRVAILKDTALVLEEAKKKIKANANAEKFLGLALIVCPLIMGSAISEALQKLMTITPKNAVIIREGKEVIAGSMMTGGAQSFFPLHMRLVAGYSLLLFVTALILKQGIFLLLQDKIKDKNAQKSGSVAMQFMLLLSTAIFFVIGAIIVKFYLDPETPLEQGATIVSLVALFTLLLCSICSGYFKSTGYEAVILFDKFENREDFKKVLADYQQWIGLFINNLSVVKLRHIRDKAFSLKLKSYGEMALGIATSPFLAFGVSNTLAMCFPEAAGWIRISGLRLSPVFLVLATFMIIFAFFSLTTAFVCTKRVNGAEVIKHDGFNNYMHHGVDLFGSEAVKKLQSEGFRSFLIAISIIIIEFTMNVSYFMQEMGGGDWKGIGLSFVAALVPTALLVAETFMLSHTQFEIHTCDEILARLDKEID